MASTAATDAPRATRATTIVVVKEITAQVQAFWAALGFATVFRVPHPPTASLDDGAPLGFAMFQRDEFAASIM